jgi:transcription antitermination factor NusG
MYCVENNVESAGNFHWNALHTRYQHEKKVEALLSAKGFQTFLPTYESTRRWKDRNKRGEEALFPGYLFVANASSEDRLRVVATPGVCAIVSVAGVPAAISNQEIETIRKTVSDPAKVEPHPYLNGGDLVEVQWGPLAGVKGTLIRKRDSYRLVVSVEILGRAAAVEIDASCVAKVSWGRTLGPVQSSCPVNRAQFSS